ncbi:MAG TPA: chlorite dismutase family protein [Thermoanaerobaculia bacterium]|nr:chlorite dismutase family protein [Thermoanaerobaculia bacterium]
MSRSDRELDLRERSRTGDGREHALDRRLFLQLLAFGGVRETAPLAAALERSGLCCVLYEDLGDPSGVGLLTLCEQPEELIDRLRPLVREPPFGGLAAKPELVMVGRTYALGFESDLEEALLERPRRRALDPANRWAIWYPLRRAPSFERLDPGEQHEMMVEHGSVARSFGQAGVVADIRLSCHGLDQSDNDFVIGLLGPELHPLSRLVQEMRKTRQTADYLTSLGPFFVGRVAWQSAMP